jgi:hypothetical protein
LQKIEIRHRAVSYPTAARRDQLECRCTQENSVREHGTLAQQAELIEHESVFAAEPIDDELVLPVAL